MSFQAYLDNIQAKTGKTAADFRKLAQKKGFLKEGTKATEILTWLKDEFGLGHGHAMAIYSTLKAPAKAAPVSEKIDRHFTAKKSLWRPVFDKLITELERLGEDLNMNANSSYIIILRGKKKIAIIQVTIDRLDIGIKLKGVAASPRFEKAGSWNTMVTHRVRISTPSELNNEVISWLQSAYHQN